MLFIIYEEKEELSRGGSGAVWGLHLRERCIRRFYRQTEALVHGYQYSNAIMVTDSNGRKRIAMKDEKIPILK